MSVTKLRIFQFGNALHTFDVHISSNIEKLRSLFDFLYILVFMGASISLFIKRSTLRCAKRGRIVNCLLDKFKRSNNLRRDPSHLQGGMRI